MAEAAETQGKLENLIKAALNPTQLVSLFACYYSQSYKNSYAYGDFYNLNLRK